ncbi:hypothetical protein L3Q82_001850 [Scortum barcoo]|uniref:Uncharacterized protein n=1 Tax=Scortum barcoo TaxID=214431 RepID=A0ACB8W5S1_9TELE|nr:hypothetical protein L3Q82_001850 [Scortum barcoo]
MAAEVDIFTLLKTRNIPDSIINQLKDDKENATTASYEVAKLIAQHGKPFTDGDFIKQCLIKVTEIICLEKVQDFNNAVEKIGLKWDKLCGVTNGWSSGYDGLVTQLKKKFHKNAKVESRETIQSLIAEVDALLLTEDGKEPQKFETMSRVKAFKFTEELNEFLYHHTVESMPPITPEKSTERSGRPSSVPLSRATVCFEIENKAWSYPGLMRWWQLTQIGQPSLRVIDTIMDPEAEAPMEPITVSPVEVPDTIPAVSPAKLSEPPKPTEPAQDTIVTILIEKLVTRIFKKSKIAFHTKDPNKMIIRLVRIVLAEVEGLDLDLSSKKIKSLDKNLFNHLCKKRRCPEMVLNSIIVQDAELESFIVLFYKTQLTKPQEHKNAINRFFWATGRVISSYFMKNSSPAANPGNILLNSPLCLDKGQRPVQHKVAWM